MSGRLKYRASNDEAMVQLDMFKKEYPPFVPFTLTEKQKQHIIELYSLVLTTQNGEDVDDYGVNDPGGDYPPEKLNIYFPELPVGSKVLFLGTGSGREVLAAKTRGYECVGITLGSRNVAFGRKVLGLAAHEIMEAPMEALPFPPEYFDLVVGFQVFEHTMAPLVFLLEQSRVLKTGHDIILEWPPSSKFSDGASPHHQVCFTPGQTEALLLKAGFESVQLFDDQLVPTPRELIWNGDHTTMHCARATKVFSDTNYIKKARNLR